MKIANREIGPGHPVYITAEAGLAHLGSLDLAMEMLHAAKEAGADAFKTQWWDVDNSHKLFSGPRKSNRCLSRVSIVLLKEECERVGIHFLCTPHDEYALKYIAKTCPAIKIGSGERGNLVFIEKASRRDKPLIISSGSYTDHDITLVNELMEREGTDFSWLFCISKYPTIWEDVKGQMPDFRNSIYDGWSSHTAHDWNIDLAAVAAGAKIIEKHIKPDFYGDIETSLDMKAGIRIGRFGDWCNEVRRIDGLFS